MSLPVNAKSQLCRGTDISCGLESRKQWWGTEVTVELTVVNDLQPQS